MNRKLPALLLAALLLAAGIASAEAPVNKQSEETAIPTTALLASEEQTAQALRSRPSKKGEALGYYFNGVYAQVGAAPANGWVQVSIGSLTGYLRQEDLILDPPADVEAGVLPVVNVAYQDGPSLTLRAGQSYQSEKLGGYPNGTQMTVLGFTEDFVHVVGPDDKIGFMMAWGVSPQLTMADVQDIAEESAAPEPGASKGAQQPAATQAPQVPAATPPADAELVSVNNSGGQGAHLRKRASANSDTLGLYPNGSQVYLVRWGEWWCRVWVDGQTGYMMTKLLNVEQPQASVTP